MLLSPLDVVVPSDGALSTLVSPQLDASTKILRDATPPTRLLYRAIDSLYLVPALVGDDVWEVCRGEGVFGGQGRCAATREGRR